MLAKKYRLTTKDINFIFKKQNMIFGKYFSFVQIPQYPNRQYNQRGVQIGLKFSKKSVLRNLVKRIIYDYVRDNNYILDLSPKGFFKIFVITNKDTNNLLKQIVETKDKNTIKEEIRKIVDHSFNNLIKHLGRK